MRHKRWYTCVSYYPRPIEHAQLSVFEQTFGTLTGSQAVPREKGLLLSKENGVVGE